MFVWFFPFILGRELSEGHLVMPVVPEAAPSTKGLP